MHQLVVYWQMHRFRENGENCRQIGSLSERADSSDTPHVVDTLGGRMHLRWDRGAATAHGQLVFFAEYWPPPACSSAGCRSAR